MVLIRAASPEADYGRNQYIHACLYRKLAGVLVMCGVFKGVHIALNLNDRAHVDHVIC